MNAVKQLEQIGYRFQLAIDFTGPDNPSEMARGFLNELAANKDEAICWLLERKRASPPETLKEQEWVMVPPSEGDAYTVFFDGTDEGQRKRWGLAAQAGLIHVTDKIKVYRHTGKCRISFRCAMPLEWLQGMITTICKQQYNAVLVHIHRAELWFKANTGDSRHEENCAKFAALNNDLKILYNAASEPLEDPFEGYQG